MNILGIESSCDETAAAVIQDGRRILSNVVHTQIDTHKLYGGVVPEVAARSHIEVINPVVNKAISDAGLSWDDIDAIAVSYAPGLIGSLLVGTLAARTLAVIHNKPLYPVHHVEAHVYANFLTEVVDSRWEIVDGGNSVAGTKRVARESERQEQIVTDFSQSLNRSDRTREAAPLRADSARIGDDASGVYETGAQSNWIPDQVRNDRLQLPSKQPAFPMLALIVSGGHSQLVLFRDHGDYELLGQKQDDAVGEAFDKVAKILGLPYPGGPSIAKAALSGDPKKYHLPKARLQNPYDYSFSGLKTAVLRAVQREVGVDHTFPSFELAARLNDVQRADFAASFQSTAVETLVDNTEKAFKAYGPKSVVIAGGVAANQELRRQLRERLPLPIEYAPMQLCTDNAAMVGALGYYMAQKKDSASPYELEVVPSLSMTKTAWA